MKSLRLAGLLLIVLDDQGPLLASEQAVLDLLGEIHGSEADMIVVPVSRLPDSFFRLATGFAGAVLQKLTNYGLRIAIVGDIPENLRRSKPLQDFMRESNRRRQVVFARDQSELATILAR